MANVNFFQSLLNRLGFGKRSPGLFERTFTPVSHPPRQTLDQRYLDMRAAMASGEAANIHAILFEHFSTVDVHGNETGPQPMIDSVLKLDIDRSKRSVATTIVSVEESNGVARVVQHYSMETTETVAPHMPKRLQTLSADVWVKDGSEWKLSKTSTLELEVFAGSGAHRHLVAKNAPSASRRFPLFVTAKMWEYIEPIARGQRYEDPLDAFLIRNGLGELDGGGTQLGDSPGIEYVDVTFILKDSHAALEQAAAELGRLGAPVGSELQFTQNGRQNAIPFGTTECLAVFLDGVGLPPEIYKSSDVNVTVKTLSQALADQSLGEFRSHWRGNSETALFFNGASADKMKTAMMPVLLSDPLCQNARLVARFGHHPNGSSEERIPFAK